MDMEHISAIRRPAVCQRLDPSKGEEAGLSRPPGRDDEGATREPGSSQVPTQGLRMCEGPGYAGWSSRLQRMEFDGTSGSGRSATKGQGGSSPEAVRIAKLAVGR
ncbi:uncharacterized protein BP5553_04685 [Venustampulla echinocandica]|uniref:Uncharacterized protein n=1 Tax=Venustampulla echinocandica TaxID=2656787 RepID=A0A370TP00_9HELO|nr:uncharacterized protein BP5553_04685 [Venustampulla echinocandica]RDL37252.1 hypothetical protein BP5553_04685 [Venustampulla echinocandica]